MPPKRRNRNTRKQQRNARSQFSESDAVNDAFWEAFHPPPPPPPPPPPLPHASPFAASTLAFPQERRNVHIAHAGDGRRYDVGVKGEEQVATGGTDRMKLYLK